VAEPVWHQGACATLAPDGVHVVIGTARGAVQRFRIGDRPAVPLTLPRVSPRKPVVFLPESPPRLLWMKDTHARVLDTASGREIAGGFAYPTGITRLGAPNFDPPVRSDLKFVVVPTDEGMQAWELGARGVIHVAALEGADVVGGEYTFSPRGDLVAIGFGDPFRIGVWNLRTGTLAGPIFYHPTYLRPSTVHFSPDGSRFTVGSLDGTCMVVEVATARSIVTFETRPFVPLLAVALSSDGARVLTSNARNETRVWNASTGEPTTPPRETTYTRAWATARFSPDGRWFATWGTHATNLWDATTGAPVGKTIPAGGSVVRFSKDSRSVGTASETTARVWDVPSGQPLTEPMVFGNIPLGFPEFSPDGHYLRIEHGGRYYIWSIPPRPPEGTPVPEWLLSLATICASKSVNDGGELVDGAGPTPHYEDIVRALAALPPGAPLADWGRWIVHPGDDRSIAPGFTIGHVEMDEKVAAELATRPGRTAPR
jgi:WD40 repeat protein